jgi:predicted Holliday junction resolvase-like endonuclease
MKSHFDATMVRRLEELSERAVERASALQHTWQHEHTERIRCEQLEIARREADTDKERWKLEYEAEIRRDNTARSQAVTTGKVAEQLAPYLPEFEYNPKDARFLGTPVDFVVFDGMSDGESVQVVFLEVKSGSSSLNERQRRIRTAIESRRVKWGEMRVLSKVTT